MESEVPYVTTGEVTTLEHEVRDDSVESRAGVTEALLASAESTEVLSSLGDDVGEEVEVDAARLLCKMNIGCQQRLNDRKSEERSFSGIITTNTATLIYRGRAILAVTAGDRQLLGPVQSCISMDRDGFGKIDDLRFTVGVGRPLDMTGPSHSTSK
jgi:hypothetical protein